MPQDGHQGVLIVTAKTSPKNQQQKREDVIYSIPEGKKPLFMDLKTFFWPIWNFLTVEVLPF